MQYVDLDAIKHTRPAWRIALLLSIVVMVVGRFTKSAAQENYATWNYSANCTLNTSATGGGANVAGAVNDFPVLIRLNSSNFNFAQALANGADIRFTKSDGTHLNYQIERFAGNTLDSAEIWVRVPQILGNSKDQSIKMYWGNISAVDSSRPALVFDTANGWSGVWHFNGTGDLRDVTYRGLLDTNHATVTGAGNITSGIDMAVGRWIGVNPALMTGMDSNITVSFWNNGNTSGLPKVDDRVDIIKNAGNEYYNGLSVRILQDTTINWYWGDANGLANANFKPTSTAQWMGQWNQWTFRRDPANWWFYINGVQVSNGTTNRSMFGSVVNRVEFGASDAGGDYSYRGKLDEMRYSNSARSADWIKLEYENQKSSQSLVRIGGAVSLLAPTISYTPTTIIDTQNVLAAVLTPTLGGGAATSITISSALPAGLSFNTSNGVITGTPTTLQAATSYTITATNAIGSGIATINLSVLIKRPAIAYAPTAVIDTQNVLTTTIVPTVTGGTASTITITPAFTNGLLFTAATGAISGTPTATQGPLQYIIKAVNASDSAKDTITISVVPQRPSIAYPATLSATQGSAIAVVTPTLGLGQPYSFTIAPTQPAGLLFNATTGVISGTPADTLVATPYIIKATNASDSAKDTITITIVAALAAPAIVYTPSTMICTLNVAIPNNTPVNSGGGAITGRTISAGLPAWILFDPSNGMLSGTPTALSVAVACTVTFTNAAGSSRDTVTISVVPAIVIPRITYPVQSAIYTLNVAIPANVPTNTGTAAVYRISPALPAGLIIDSITGTISGTPTAVIVSAVVCTVTAFNSKGSGKDTITMAVSSDVQPPFITYNRQSMICTVGVADSSLVVNSGGAATYTSTALPAGLVLDAATGKISGTPTAYTALASYYFTATNSASTALDTVTIAVIYPTDRTPPTNNAALTLSAPRYNQIIASWTTPESNSADADSVYLLYSKTHFPTGIADTGTLRAATSFKSITAGSLSATLNGLSSTTRYYFALVINDTTHTNFSNRITDSITTPIAPDTIAPFINDSILTLNALSATQISVMWNTPESPSPDADSVVVLYSYTRIPVTPFDTADGVCRVMGVYPAIDSVGTASHILTGLSERMMYYVALFVRDAAHNYSTRVASSVATRGSNEIINNPLVVRGRYADSNHIAIKISNFSALDITVFPPPFVDSIGVWYNAGSFLPTPVRTSAALIKYPISVMIANNTGGVFSALLPVPVLTSDTVYCISATPFWRQPDSLPLFVAGNGDRVLMRDTIRPLNSLTVAGQYLGGDSVMLTIGNLASLDTLITDSVVIWHGMNDSAVFADTQFTLRLSARAIRQAGTLTYPRMIKDLRFKSLSDTAYAVWQLVGRNTNRSTSNDTFFAVGNLRPQNPVVLTADVVSASRVKLTWTDPAADSVRLWYGTAGIPKTWDIPATFLSVKQPITARSDTIEGLQSQTTYFFGIQIYRNGLWSIVTAASSDTVTTPAITDTSRIINTVDITELVFDTATNEIRVRWQVDTTLGEQYVGIQYGIGSYSLSLPTTGLTVRTAAQGTMVIQLREPLRFDTTYYVSIWVQKVDGQWSLPTTLSQDTVAIPPFTWQAISYFNRSMSPDTVRANNGRIVLFNDPAYDLEVLNDVLDRVPLNSTVTGFIPVSTGFKFRNGYESLPFNVGFAYDTALARVYGAKSIRMYRMVLGSLMVEDNTFIDSVAGIVYVRTDKLVDPFIAAIDTVVPTVTILSNDTSIHTLGKSIQDTIRVSDNIGNVKWWLEAGKGGVALRLVPPPLSGNAVSGNNGIINTSVNNAYIDNDNGVRILLITSDGVHTDTINLSRQVIRQIAETYTIPMLRWRPLYTAAIIDNPTSDSCLWDLQADGETSWKFDIKRYRVFRWYETAVNQPLPDKWVELADSNKQHFSFVPGRLMWVKTAAEQSVVMGRGVTMSLRKNYTGIKLPPHSWTDFGLPFRFKMRLSDIMAATGAKADSLEWYGWRAGTDSLYAATPLYVPGHARPELRIASGVTLSFKDSVEGYTVYNRRSDTVTLVVPPIPSVMSRATGAIAKVKNTPAWCLSVITCNAARQPIGRVECGYLQNRGGSAKVFMLPPSFTRVTTAITDEARSGRFGHKIYSQPQDGGYFFDVVFSNTTDEAQTIRYTIAGLAQLPPELSATIVRNNTSINPIDTIVITLAPNSQQHELLAVGDAGYLAKINNKFRGLEILLGSVFPNPVGRMLTIRYNLPFSGVSAVKFEVYDVAGRIVWSKMVKNGLRAGANTLAWDTKQTTQLARGLYILRMKVVDEQGNSNKVLTNKFTYLGR